MRPGAGRPPPARQARKGLSFFIDGRNYHGFGAGAPDAGRALLQYPHHPYGERA
ncbi:hypothetical protein L494_4444 [Bordetella bronchiseptica CA90 BB1334]|nr:hypothetical protein L571_3295 [Bordetella pertussis 2371640]ETH14676.1 hypothetical protein L575_2417 [Bordetella pertussis STO1-SEAT-0007]KAK74355.1 hypothetical protein L507_4274 [Bordetella bronchiseptica CA90 BB02]KCV30235.1 hypothetical protein L489_4778 [Bordetella bronchiseptica 00-P-2730]KDB75788.1 hypothetical protein L494_4444 [Bordetella bronchiseptica CA90 BB1334]KDC61648.1 hypothetical protein L510_4459 [Bordetella bronchiseptica MBORD591]KDD12844.1 hypothetical protein L522_